MYVPYSENADVESLTEEERKLADQAADDFASHRFQSEEY